MEVSTNYQGGKTVRLCATDIGPYDPKPMYHVAAHFTMDMGDVGEYLRHSDNFDAPRNDAKSIELFASEVAKAFYEQGLLDGARIAKEAIKECVEEALKG